MDYVAQLPVPIMEYQKSNGDMSLVKVEPGLVAKISDQSYFIHCAATLPIKDTASDLGFGLWVEVSKDDFLRYTKAQQNDQEYAMFSCQGTLANNWPLFPGTYGDSVVIKVVEPTQKPFIVDIEPSDAELTHYKEPGSLNQHQKESLRKRIREYYLQ